MSFKIFVMFKIYIFFKIVPTRVIKLGILPKVYEHSIYKLYTSKETTFSVFLPDFILNVKDIINS